MTISRAPWRALAALLVVSCGCSFGRASISEPNDEDETSVGTSVSLHRDSGEAILERGKQLALDGRYGEAASAFQRLYDKGDAKRELRAAALFELGDTYSNVLNPDRNVDRALGFFERLVQEFPNSGLRKKAEARLESLSEVPR